MFTYTRTCASLACDAPKRYQRLSQLSLAPRCLFIVRVLTLLGHIGCSIRKAHGLDASFNWYVGFGFWFLGEVWLSLVGV
jgi:hypothetical protein